MRKIEKDKNNKGATFCPKFLIVFDEISYQTGFSDQLSYYTKCLFDEMSLEEMRAPSDNKILVIQTNKLVLKMLGYQK